MTVWHLSHRQQEIENPLSDISTSDSKKPTRPTNSQDLLLTKNLSVWSAVRSPWSTLLYLHQWTSVHTNSPDVKSLLTPQHATAGVSMRWQSGKLGGLEAAPAQLPWLPANHTHQPSALIPAMTSAISTVPVWWASVQHTTFVFRLQGDLQKLRSRQDSTLIAWCTAIQVDHKQRRAKSK